MRVCVRVCVCVCVQPIRTILYIIPSVLSEQYTSTHNSL